MNATSDISARFDELTRAYYRSWFRFHPEAAVEVGEPGYEHLLTPWDEQARGALVCLNDKLRIALEELDESGLDPDRRLDYELLYGSVRLENRYLIELEPRRPDPRHWLPVRAIYQLTIRAVDDLEQALGARLAAIPAHLQAAATALAPKAEAMPPEWVAATATAARRGAEFVGALGGHPRIAALPGGEAVVAAGAKAAEALERFGEILAQEMAPRARGAFACGPEYFEHLLRQRHFLDVGSDQVHAFGERLFERTRAQLEDACQERLGHRDFVRAVRELQSRHPPAERLLAVYTERMRAAREFVRARDLVTLPARERLEVVPTPVFLRHEIPFAAYSEPAANDPEQAGHYYVTPPADAEQLAEHDELGLGHTCVHEAYPGHHLQFVTANLSPAAHSWPRLLNTSATFYEGWALYSEQLMHEQGFLDHGEGRILLLRDRLWRALRVMLDVELQTRDLGVEAAAERMVAALGFPRSQALADIAWYTRSPTVPLGYALGWALINALRERALRERALRARVQRREPDAGLRSFHDRLLSVGSVAAPLVIRRAFGDDLWQAAKSDVFGETDETH